MKERLKFLLRHLNHFEDSDLEKIVQCFKPKSVKKNAILLRSGTICTEFYFVHSGCIRTYFLDKKGIEKTRLLAHDCSIGTALTSFISQKPSFEFVEALEDSELLYIHHIDFYKLNKELVSWKEFYQNILEMAYSFQNKKIESLVSLNAAQRFQQLMLENPSLIQRVSNKVLASYLDITPETLSRLKSKVAF